MKVEISDIISKASKYCEDEMESEAEELLRIGLETHPDNPELLTMLGNVLVRLDRDEEAESIFRQVLEMDPCHEKAGSALGRLLDNSMRSQEAEKVLRSLIASSPECHIVTDDLCRLLISEGRTEEALTIANRHVDNFPSSLNAYDALRYTLMHIENAIEDQLCVSSDNNQLLKQLAENIVQQLDVMIKLTENIDLQEIIKRGFQEEIVEEFHRLISELEHVQNRLPDIPNTLFESIQGSLVKGKQIQTQISH